MTKNRSTKNALLSSVLALVLCCSMLLGTTFAWFTDSVTSANNVIMSGNLDVTLEYLDANGKWTDVQGTDEILDKEALWEPGYAEVAYFRLKNAGSLALKYQLGVNIVSETKGVNQKGEEFKLSDYIYFDVVEVDGAEDEVETFASRDKAIEAINGGKLISEGYTQADELAAKSDYVYLAMVVYMPTTVGNVANHDGENAPKIELGINVFATQYTAEMDSFGDDYDEGTVWTGLVDIDWYAENPDAQEFVISSPEDLAGLAAIVNGTAMASSSTYAASKPVTVKDDFKGKTIKLGGNIDLNDVAWTPIGDSANPFRGNFDGQGYTVSNLYVSNEGWAGLIGHAGLSSPVTIKNVTIDGVTILSNRMAGAVAGQVYGNIENCHVKNATIMVTPNAVANGYDNGDKVGGIVGWLGDNGNNRVISNCSVEKVQLGAYRDVGGIAGYVASSTTVEKNTATEVKITVDQTTNYYGEKDFNAGKVYGRTGGSITDAGNVVDEASAIDITYSKNGLTLKSDGENNVVLYLVPASLEAETVVVPEGVTAIGGYAFAYNTNVKEIILPSTVTTLNDRAFRDTSATTVVLNEGLTNISYQAFRNAANVTSVVIPSTVTTISKEAFQNSGVTTLTIPANVTTIEYGGCRDMKKLESVVIEGNVDIPVYAFRACTELKSVTILGENVTFGDGSRGMIFTNKENGDGSAITVTVANEEIKNRLCAADTAAKDYGGYTIVCAKTAQDGLYTDANGDTYAYASEDADLTAALANGAKTVYVNAATYTFPASSIKAGTELVCAPGTEFAGKTGLNINGATVVGATFTNENGYLVNSTTINGIFKDCVFTNSDGLRYCYAGEKVVFENCVFDTDFYGVHFDGGANEVLFRNCTFTGFNTFGAAITKLTLEGCTFKYNGKGGYNGINLWGDTDMKDCTFVFDGSASYEWVDLCTDNQTVTFTNCVVTDGKIEKGMETVVGNYGTGNTIIIDGAYLATENEMLNAAITAGATEILLADGTYVIPDSAAGKTLTIVGNGNTVLASQDDGASEGDCDYSLRGSTVTFENVTITTTSTYFPGYAGMKGIYNNCTINGVWSLYDDAEFNNCTFNVSGDVYNLWTWGAAKATFNGCIFNNDGKAVLLYGGTDTKLTMNDCVFNDNGGLTDKKAAIEIGNDYGRSYELIVNRATVNGYEINDKGINTGSTLWGNKNSMGTDKLNVVVDGVDVY